MQDQEIRDRTATGTALFLVASTLGSGYAVHAMTGNLKAAFTVAAIGFVTTIGAAAMGLLAGGAGQRIDDREAQSKSFQKDPPVRQP